MATPAQLGARDAVRLRVWGELAKDAEQAVDERAELIGRLGQLPQA